MYLGVNTMPFVEFSSLDTSCRITEAFIKADEHLLLLNKDG